MSAPEIDRRSSWFRMSIVCLNMHLALLAPVKIAESRSLWLQVLHKYSKYAVKVNLLITH
eukprot:5270174-Amphidinium_carterae.1